MEGHELLVVFLDEDGEDAALPHLVQDADAHRGGADRQQHEQQDLVLFTAGWDKLPWQQCEETGASFFSCFGSGKRSELA